jgi:hypothetical protein
LQQQTLVKHQQLTAWILQTAAVLLLYSCQRAWCACTLERARKR